MIFIIRIFNYFILFISSFTDHDESLNYLYKYCWMYRFVLKINSHINILTLFTMKILFFFFFDIRKPNQSIELILYSNDWLCRQSIKKWNYVHRLTESKTWTYMYVIRSFQYDRRTNLYIHYLVLSVYSWYFNYRTTSGSHYEPTQNNPGQVGDIIYQ